MSRTLAQQGEAEKPKLDQYGEELVLRSSSMPVAEVAEGLEHGSVQ